MALTSLIFCSWKPQSCAYNPSLRIHGVLSLSLIPIVSKILGEIVVAIEPIWKNLWCCFNDLALSLNLCPLQSHRASFILDLLLITYSSPLTESDSNTCNNACSLSHISMVLLVSIIYFILSYWRPVYANRKTPPHSLHIVCLWIVWLPRFCSLATNPQYIA